MCQLTLNAAIVVVNMHPNFCSVLFGSKRRTASRIKAVQHVTSPGALRRVEENNDVEERMLVGGDAR